MKRIVIAQRCNTRRFLATTVKRRRKQPPQPKQDANFGIKPVDYSITPPIIPTPLAPPPRQGTKAAFVRMVWPLTLIMTMSLGFYIYMNEEEDNYDFWKSIETGGAIVADDDDDDDEDEGD
jgi:hypothetical protein